MNDYIWLYVILALAGLAIGYFGREYYVHRKRAKQQPPKPRDWTMPPEPQRDGFTPRRQQHRNITRPLVEEDTIYRRQTVIEDDFPVVIPIDQMETDPGDGIPRVAIPGDTLEAPAFEGGQFGGAGAGGDWQPDPTPDSPTPDPSPEPDSTPDTSCDCSSPDTSCDTSSSGDGS